VSDHPDTWRSRQSLNHMTAACPQCQSLQVVTGQLRPSTAAHDVGAVAFYLPSTKWKFFLISEPCVFPDEHASVCLACGLLWTRVDPREVQRLNKKHGK